MRRRLRLACLLVLAGLFSHERAAYAGPETALREFAGGQVKKGVRTIGMGGDGATTGNYALVYKEGGGAVFDEGLVRFRDTGNLFTFSAVGFSTPPFWNDAVLYVIALGQTGTGVKVWDTTPQNPKKPRSMGDLGDTSVFVKFAKPINAWLSFGVMGAFELSHATLVPDGGGPTIRFSTSYLPSGGLGLHAHPGKHWQFGARVILNHDHETRTEAKASTSGLLRSYEYRLGAAWSPVEGTLFDAGIVALDRSNGLEHTTTFAVHPAIGFEQAIVPKRVWVRIGLDETTGTTGLGVAISPVKVDLAYLYDLAEARTQDVFGKRNVSLIGTLSFEYWKLFHAGAAAAKAR